ncbi:RNA polymerase sigma factor [Hymenobacter metallicola]|uniref:RNA polymerase sigma factor n=1 Tax=Hymenobacter metallicola TaxID=2563114 RepID=A0A4Z0QGN9_9BACT|nr:sigma-70 family RNA polymerase sigma factor [Hymenobacter metallicola]TGE28885.1 sigma-70 family RNA polymerase sigma factor [Hymenobacter metallicola]
MSAATTALFDELYQSHQRRVWRLCLGYCGGDTEQADDLLQEVFLRVWLNLDRFRHEAALSTWLYRITVNTCLQWVRQTKRRPDTPVPVLPEQPAPPPDPQAAQLARLHRALGQLPEADRLLMMLVLDEQPYARIADICDQTEGNIRVRLHRIRQRLTQLLHHLPDEDDAA